MITYLAYLHGLDVTCLQMGITLVLFYNGSEEEGRENFKEFFDLSKPIIELSLDRTEKGLVDQSLFLMVQKRSPLKNSIPLRFVSCLRLSARTNATGAE